MDGVSINFDTGKHRDLIYNGTGPYLGPAGGHLPDHLRNLDVAPEEIDTIIISHSHLDHMFGTLALDGSQLFPEHPLCDWGAGMGLLD